MHAIKKNPCIEKITLILFVHPKSDNLQQLFNVVQNYG